MKKRFTSLSFFALIAIASCGSPGPVAHDGGASSDAGDSGVLATPCVAPEVDCGGACVDTQTSLASCGSCGHACGATQTCTSGQCVVVCNGTGHSVCGGACIDTRTDPTHCGSCTNACASDKVCSGGACIDDPCAAYADCVHCTPDARCGWCATTNTCASESRSGSCSFWLHGTC